MKSIRRLIDAFMSRYNILFSILSDRFYLKLEFWVKTGSFLDFDHPLTFNEKLQWLKIYNRKEIMTTMADKFLAKDFVAKMIGNKFVIPTLAEWDDPDKINFDILPDRFVLKTNHDSGGVYICKAKSELDKTKAKRIMKKSFKRNYYKLHREWPYKNIKRKIIAEPYLEDKSGELRDYKLLLFNGKFKCAFTCTERFSQNGLKVTFFDENWNVMPFERKYHRSSKEIPAPKSLPIMIQFAEKLSKGFVFLRVDFYEINDEPVFGELTFYPGSGYEMFTPQKYDKILGDWINLTNFKAN